MSKKLMNMLLLAAMVLGLSVSVTSCKDDDADTGNEQKKDDISPLDTDDARVAFRWLCALADVDTLDVNWQSKQYEPTVGEASENNQFTRIIVVNDLEKAKEDFSRLADMDVSQLATKQTVNGGAAGTMTWEPSKAGAENLAVVAVNSKIMPHLQKLVYCTQEQTGQNGWFGNAMSGVAYYRLGDVVRDFAGHCWVCVCPSFAPNNPKSHWINIYNASKKGSYVGQRLSMLRSNVYDDCNEKPKYNNQTIKLPTQLGYDRQQIYNLNNFIWALLNPEAYRDACLANKSIGLCDFNYIYHGTKFLNDVANFWDINYERLDENGCTVWERVFGLTREEMKTLTSLNFYYQGYKWWWGNTPDFWVYRSTGYVKKYSETGSEKKDKVTDYDVVANGFDITRYAGDPTAKKVGPEQFVRVGNGVTSATYVIRYKTGDQLNINGTYDPYKKINGCTDFYVYNTEKNVKVGKDEVQETEETFKQTVGRDKPSLGMTIGSDGLYYLTPARARAAGVTPTAIVVYYDRDDNIETIEGYRGYCGIAMALQDATSQAAWADANSYDFCEEWPEWDPGYCRYQDGISMTAKLNGHCHPNNHRHPAAEACRSYKVAGYTEETRIKRGFSPWFIPSCAQWIMAMRGMGITWDLDEGVFYDKNTGDGYNYMRAFLEKHGAADAILSGSYWATTECTKQEAFFIHLAEGTTSYVSDPDVHLAEMHKSKLYKVRPFFAFK